jgi:hypothetical protein
MRELAELYVRPRAELPNGTGSSAGTQSPETHQGAYTGIPPAGKSISYDEIFIMRFEDGRIAEAWGVADVVSQMRQQGAIAGGAAVLTAGEPALDGRR